jgi:thioesterase domain-containing protein
MNRNYLPKLYVAGELLVPEGFAIRLRRLGRSQFGKIDPLASYVPERATHTYALHSQKWRETFYSLTLKDPPKIVFFQPEFVEISADTLIAEMSFATQFLWHGREDDARNYANSVRLLSDANINEYNRPELLIPPKEICP